MTTANEESEVQENVVSTLNWKNSDLCSLSGMVKHVQGNGKIYCLIVLLLLSALIVLTPALRLYYNQSRHQRFRQWIILSGII